MKVEGPGSLRNSGAAKRTGRSDGSLASAFARALHGTDDAAASGVNGAQAAGAINPLLNLQEVEDSTSGPSRRRPGRRSCWTGWTRSGTPCCPAACRSRNSMPFSRWPKVTARKSMIPVSWRFWTKSTLGRRSSLPSCRPEGSSSPGFRHFPKACIRSKPIRDGCGGACRSIYSAPFRQPSGLGVRGCRHRFRRLTIGRPRTSLS